MSGAVVVRKEAGDAPQERPASNDIFSLSANNSTPTLATRASQEQDAEKAVSLQEPVMASDVVLESKGSQIPLSPRHARAESTELSDLENGPMPTGPSGPGGPKGPGGPG